MSWARLLKRVFDIDIEHCPNCGGASSRSIPDNLTAESRLPTQADDGESDRAARSPAPRAPAISAPPSTLPSKTLKFLGAKSQSKKDLFFLGALCASREIHPDFGCGSAMLG